MSKISHAVSRTSALKAVGRQVSLGEKRPSIVKCLKGWTSACVRPCSSTPTDPILRQGWGLFGFVWHDLHMLDVSSTVKHAEKHQKVDPAVRLSHIDNVHVWGPESGLLSMRRVGWLIWLENTLPSSVQTRPTSLWARINPCPRAGYQIASLSVLVRSELSACYSRRRV